MEPPHSLIVTGTNTALVWYPGQGFVFQHRITDGAIEPSHVRYFDAQADSAESALVWMREHIAWLDHKIIKVLAW